MFDPNEDIEDLYRRAADRFDLESSGPDWQKMSKALDKLGAPTPHSPGGSTGMLRKLLMGNGRMVPVGITVAVIVAGLVVMVVVKREVAKPAPATAAATAKEAINQLVSPAQRVSGAGGVNGSSVAGAAAGGSSVVGGAGAEGGSSAAGGTSVVGGSGVAASLATTGGASSAATGHKGTQRNKGVFSTQSGAGASGADASGAGSYGAGDATGNDATARAGQANTNVLDIPLTTNTDLSLFSQVRTSTDRLQLSRHQQPLVQVTSTGTGPVASSLRQAGRFSAGFSGALDLSFVEGQPLSQPGSTAGILTGFQLTRRLNLETGIYMSHKIYFSSGKPLPKIPVQNGGKVLNVRGHASMLELPLTLRYTILATSTGMFYAGAGEATYLVNSEMYQYQAEWLGKKREGEWIYPGKIPQHLFSALTAHAGYVWNVGKTDMLRTELYGKLPLVGLGKASLPVVSTGLSLSYLHAF